MQWQGANEGAFASMRGCFPLISCRLGPAEHTSGNDQIGQGKETVKLGEIFPQPPISDLPVSKEVFDEEEGMLHLGSYLSLPAFPFPQQILPQSFGHRRQSSLLLFPVKEMLGLADVTDIGGGRHKAMH